VKVAVVLPFEIGTDAGTLATDGLLELKLTTCWTAVGPVRVIVAVTTVVELPCTLVVLRPKAPSCGASMVMVPVLLVPVRAVTVTLAVAVTGDVWAVNVAEVLSARTVTEAGTLHAPGFELVSPTETPPVGAGALIFTVPVTTVDVPPTTLLGANETAVGVGGRTEMTTAFETPWKEAVIVTDFVTPTTLLVIRVDTLDAPDGMLTVDGTEATAGFDELNEMVTPPVGAVWPILRLTFATVVDPPTNETGLTASAVNSGARTAAT